MKNEILDILQSKGNLKEKKLLKKILKQIGRKDDEEDEELLNQYKKTLEELVEEKDILLVNNEYCINKVKSSKAATKRLGTFDNLDEDEPLFKKSKATTEASHTVTKKFDYPDLWRNGEKFWKEGTFDPEYLRTNPDNITRIFCGNLSKKVTEDDLKAFIPGITYIKWITDKETGEFYGSSFLEMKDPSSAAAAVMQDQSKFLGRPLKIYYCPPRPGTKWPPREASSFPTSRNNNNNNNNGFQGQEKTPKPEGCRKLFAGNLSYDIDDDTMCDFFKDCGTVIGLRWLTRKDTGEFRGSGYIEFSATEEADKAMELDGKELLGRKIRLDWTD